MLLPDLTCVCIYMHACISKVGVHVHNVLKTQCGHKIIPLLSAASLKENLWSFYPLVDNSRALEYALGYVHTKQALDSRSLRCVRCHPSHSQACAIIQSLSLSCSVYECFSSFIFNCTYFTLITNCVGKKSYAHS